jgi:hypothetical protein
MSMNFMRLDSFGERGLGGRLVHLLNLAWGCCSKYKDKLVCVLHARAFSDCICNIETSADLIQIQSLAAAAVVMKR